jgi:hypothetical protein
MAAANGRIARIGVFLPNMLCQELLRVIGCGIAKTHARSALHYKSQKRAK